MRGWGVFCIIAATKLEFNFDERALFLKGDSLNCITIKIWKGISDVQGRFFGDGMARGCT